MEGASVFGAGAFYPESEDAGKKLGEGFGGGRQSCAGGGGAELVQERGCVSGPDGVAPEEGSEGVAERIGAKPHGGGIGDGFNDFFFGEAKSG